MTPAKIQQFRDVVYKHYDRAGRMSLPWRQPTAQGQFDPYVILVSEVMLQQTQVSRVIPKFEAFLKRFPDVETLARAPLGDVLRAWSGLGYNRRAKYLHQAARLIHEHSKGRFPQTLDELRRLPGVGRNTAGAILAYAYNQPAVFIETNIRSVFIHYFLSGSAAVSDKALLELVEQTIDTPNPRLWYWALMDYGSYLKKAHGNPNRASQQYVKQSSFKGSLRQLRGAVLRLLSGRPYSPNELMDELDDERLPAVLEALTKEGLINLTAGQYHL